MPFPSYSINYATDPGDDTSREVWLRIKVRGEHVRRTTVGTARTGSSWGAGDRLHPEIRRLQRVEQLHEGPAIYEHFDSFALRIGDEEGGANE